ncbi:MAG: hypothetical protein ACREKS_24565 [Candidatus Rokuibacteriota bacterium]
MGGPDSEAGAATTGQRPVPPPGGSVVAVVKDLFFVARIRETARLVGVPVVFARSPEELAQAGGSAPRFALVDLTADLDYARIFAVAKQAQIPVLAFTTHALARQTQPWHARCQRVVTKETLSQELGSLLQQGFGA